MSLRYTNKNHIDIKELLDLYNKNNKFSRYDSYGDDSWDDAYSESYRRWWANHDDNWRDDDPDGGWGKSYAYYEGLYKSKKKKSYDNELVWDSKKKQFIKKSSRKTKKHDDFPSYCDTHETLIQKSTTKAQYKSKDKQIYVYNSVSDKASCRIFYSLKELDEFLVNECAEISLGGIKKLLKYGISHCIIGYSDENCGYELVVAPTYGQLIEEVETYNYIC